VGAYIDACWSIQPDEKEEILDLLAYLLAAAMRDMSTFANKSARVVHRLRDNFLVATGAKVTGPNETITHQPASEGTYVQKATESVYQERCCQDAPCRNGPLAAY